MMLPDDLDALFQQYVGFYDGMDAEGIAGCFSLPATVIDDNGPHVFETREALVAKLATYCDFFQAQGYAGAEYACRNVTRMNSTTAFVDLAWQILRRGDTPLEFGTGYTLLRDDGQWRIACAAAYPFEGQGG